MRSTGPQALEAAATDTGPAATDAILDLANALTRALRGEEGETVADLNARLRSVFEEFRLDTLHDGALPVLRADVTERGWCHNGHDPRATSLYTSVQVRKGVLARRRASPVPDPSR
jgi:hypothetical protein